jgi:hypothetical protein
MGQSRRENFMRFDLCVICVLQNVLLFLETFHCFATSSNVLFVLFCEKQRCNTNVTFREAAAFFVCIFGCF